MRNFIFYKHMQCILAGRNISVGIATLYGLDDPVIETRCGQVSPHPSRPALGHHPVTYAMVTGSFPGVNLPGLGVDHPPICTVEIKEQVGL
jgi:hypothetical protein